MEPILDNAEEGSRSRSKRGAVQSGLCNFPFYFNQRNYSSCTTDGGTSFMWCSQTYDFKTDLKWSLCVDQGTFGVTNCTSGTLCGAHLDVCVLLWYDPISMSTANSFCTARNSSGGYEVECSGPVLPSNDTFCSTTTGAASTTEPPTTALSSAPFSTDVVQTTALITTPPSATADQNMTTSASSPPSTTSVQPVTTSTSSPPSTTSVQPLTTSTSSPTSTTSVQPVTTSTSPPPSNTSVQPVTTSTSPPPSNTSVQPVTTSTSSPTSTTSVQPVTTSTSSPTSTTSVQPVTTSASPSPSNTSVQPVTTSTSPPPSTTSVQPVTTSTSPPPSTTSVQPVTTSTSPPPSTTSVQPVTTSTSSPPSNTSIQPVTTSTTLSPSTMVATSVTPPLTTSITPGGPAPGTYTMSMVDLQLWENQASLNQLSSGGLGVIDSLWIHTTSSSVGFQQTEIPLVLNILGNVTKNAQTAHLEFSVTTVEKVLSVADQLMVDISLEPSVSLEQNFGPRLLGCLENVFSVMSATSQPFSKAYKNFDLFCSAFSCSDLEDNKIMFLDSSMSVSLPNENDFSLGCHMNVLWMTYTPKSGSFTGLYGSNTMGPGSYFLASAIQIYVMKLNNSTYHKANLNMTFTCGNRTCDQTALCVFWDFLSNKWSSHGCVTRVVNGSTYCMYSHLTSFAVLMSNSMPEGNDDTILDYITKVGLVISTASLLVCILIQVILMKHSVKMATLYRHVAILHMSVFLLISMVSFLVSSFIDQSAQDQLCVALTFCSHFSFIGFFSWTLIQGLYLASRLLFVFHHVTKTELVAVSVVLGYICPVAIAVGTFLVYFPNNYRRASACWLDSDSGASMAFNIPVMITLLVNFAVLIVVIRTLLRPSISQGQSEDEEALKKMAKAVVFCTPQFGLTWAVGIPLFTIPAVQNSLVLKYLFVILNPLQGFFLLLFGCLLDKKVMDLVRKHLWKNYSPSSLTTTVNTIT